MIDHLTLRVADYGRSKTFYQAALAPLGYEQIREFEGSCGLGAGGKPDFWIARSEEGRRPQVHIAFAARSHADVDRFHEAAMKAGAKDNGKPGPRKEYHENYYGAFVLDPDGHNIEACCHKPE
jgi:catechol 2,3-dioxygenase-like lactoylglutathione lyase family enzyme